MIILIATLILISFSMPWWITDGIASSGRFYIKIYGFGLHHNMVSLADYIAADETPTYQTIIAWIYISISALLVLASIWLRGKRSTLLPCLVGLGYITYALTSMFGVIAKRLQSFEISLQGITATGIYKQVGISFDSSIQPGFYLALVAGLLCIILALAQNKITGKNRTDIKDPWYNNPTDL
jgi:hypothetical protein